MPYVPTWGAHASRTFARAAPALALLLLSLCIAGDLGAQSAFRIGVDEENVRAEPGGARVAVVQRGFVVAGGEARGQWREVTLEAWVPARSVIENRRDGFDLIVAGGGAALHARPGGAPSGRAMGGVQLTEVARENGFVRVRRPAWIWSPSLASAPASALPRAPAAAAAAAPREAPAPATPQPAPPPAAEPQPPATGGPSAGRLLLTAPSGDTLATLADGARYEVTGREGEWARVRVEGWVRIRDGETLDAPGPMRGVSLRALRAEPERYRGSTLEWQVQFMALQRADSLRTDFQRGEPFILARDPGGEPGFVYIAVPADLVPAVRSLPPLQRVVVVARVRTGRSSLTGHPVLELIELRDRRR